MKRLRTRMILTLLVVNTVVSPLAELITWALMPLISGEVSADMWSLMKSTIQSAISLIIFAVLVVIGINELTQPIADLTLATQKVADGDFDVYIPESKRKDEIGQLQRNFNVMVEGLKSTEFIQKDFISNVSHEFKTPLAVISGYAKMLMDDHLTDEERMQGGESIIEEVDRLTRMTSNMLLLSKVNNQGVKPAYTRFYLDEQIRQDILLLEAKWSEKDIDFLTDMPPTPVYGNEELLSHVWLNLVDNAIKYSSEHGTIKVVTVRRDDGVYVEVSDNGIGMDEPTKERIFEQFYQGDTSREELGNGLGLALAKRIVEVHDGTISVDSTLGEGSRFTVVLPDMQEKK